MKSGIKVFAPASLANLAVGYDVLGLALDKPGDEIIIKEGTSPGVTMSFISGAKGKLSKDPTKNCAGYAAQLVLDHLGEPNRPIDLALYKKMGLGTGMGSSAASSVAGAFAVNEFLGRPLTKRQLLPMIMKAEELADGAYHADNVAPSLLGGIVLIRDNKTQDVQKLSVPKGIYITMIYPKITILTKESRAILKDTVSLDQCIKQTGNIAGLVVGLYNSDFDLIKRSLNDQIIEPQRAKLIPHFYQMKEIALSEGALGFSISGAGPSMFAFCNNSLIAENVKEKADKLFKSNKIETETFISKINLEGAVRY